MGQVTSGKKAWLRPFLFFDSCIWLHMASRHVQLSDISHDTDNHKISYQQQNKKNAKKTSSLQFCVVCQHRMKTLTPKLRKEFILKPKMSDCVLGSQT